MGDAPLSSTWGRTPQKNFSSSSWRPGPGRIPLSQGAEGRNRGLVFVTNSHILLSSKPFDSDSMAVRVPGGPGVKNMPANAGDSGDVSSVPGSGRSPEGGNGNPLQYSCLGSFMDRGAWGATVHGVAKSMHDYSPPMAVSFFLSIL